MSDHKLRLLLIDDQFKSEDDFWRSQSDAKAQFAEDFDVVVFHYPRDAKFDDQRAGIESFLEAESGAAHIVLLDMKFPGEERGGIRILRTIEEQRFDFPLVVMVSNAKEQDLPLRTSGHPFVQREILDLPLLREEFLAHFRQHSHHHPRTGILITHGTDTLGYVIEFLRYGVKNLTATNIIATGSQISMSEKAVASDAVDNMRTAVYLLRHLYAPQIGVVFNRGQQFFHHNISKLEKWDADTFRSEVAVEIDWNRFRSLSDEIRIHHRPVPLHELIVARVGGTIEAVDDGTGLRGGGDFVKGFIERSLRDQYSGALRVLDCSGEDSSNLTIEDWVALLARLHDDVGIEVDRRFEPRVGIVYPTPMTTTADYEAWMSRFEGVVIAGYGGGNGNIRRGAHSLLTAVEKYAQDHVAVLASQVAGGVTDSVYEAGRELLRAGCVPGGHLAPHAALVRLSYVLGRRSEWPSLDQCKAVFVEGLKFRDHSSAAAHAELLWKSTALKPNLSGRDRLLFASRAVLSM